MKTSLIQILIMFLFFSCKTDENKIQKVWIGKYKVQHSDLKGERISETALRQIIKFDKDSITIKNFPFNFNINEINRKFSDTYKIQKNQILTSKDTFNIENIFSDSLFISFNSGSTKRIVYEKLERYNQGERANELIDFLVSNTFTTQEDTIIIEFRKNWKYVSPDFSFGAGSNQYWMIDTFENELFIVFDGFLGGAIQIVNFNSNQVTGKIYHKDNIEVTWKKIEDKIKFDSSQIIGDWEKIQEPMFPPIEEDVEYYNKELLKITEKKIMCYDAFRKDTINWEFNRGKNIMIFPNYHPMKRRFGKQWNIVSIKNDTLTLERKSNSTSNWNLNIEINKFKRKNKNGK